MREVTQKIEDLLTLLEQKNAATEVLNRQLSEKKLALADVERRQMASDKQLSARERLVSKAEESDKAKKDLKEAIMRVQSDKLKNKEKEAELVSANAKLAKEQADLEEMKKIYTKKNQNMDALKIQLETEKKLMREKVLEEIKGKL